MDPLAKIYLNKVINESSESDLQKGQDVKGYSPSVGDAAYGDSEGDKKVKKLQPKTGPEAQGAETLEKAKEADADLSVGSHNDGKTKAFGKNYAESTNPFDALFNKILSEEGEMMDFATSENPEDSTFEPSFGGEDHEDSDEFGDGEEGEDEGDEVTFTLDRETAQKLHEVLSSVLGGEEEEGEEGEEDEFGSEEHGGGEGEEDEDESSVEGAKPFGEAIDAEELGHALVDQEKLESGLNKKGSYVVKGAVPVKKKTAQTPTTGKGHDGKLKSHSTEGGVSKLTSKGSIDAGGVKVGKFLFDNE
jgi:hypothetical protein